MLLVRRVWLLPLVTLFLLGYWIFHSSDPALRPLEPQVHVVFRPENYPVSSFTSLPTGRALQLPKIQHQSLSENPEQKHQRLERQSAIKNAFIHSWRGYTEYAWKQDEIAPLSGLYRNSFGGWGASLVDAMGTIWIMGLKSEFEECVQAVNEIDWTTNTEQVLNVFETNIRYLGGILSAYDLSEHKYPDLLVKAKELADVLYLAFDTPNRYPVCRWPWKNSASGSSLVASRSTLLAEIGSLSVEFTRLAQLTGEAKWFDAIDRITVLLYDTQDTTSLPGVWPTIVDAETGTMSYNHFTLGGMADSTSEYLPKQYMLLGGLDERYRKMYDKMMNTAKKHIFYRPLVPGNKDILFSGNAALDLTKQITSDSQGQHLTCFTGGMVGIGSRIFNRPDELAIAKKLVDGCVWAYNSTPTGLMPETFHIAPCVIGTGKPDSDDCEWSDEKWYEAVAKQHGAIKRQPGESLANAGKRVAEQERLLPGYTRWGDNRYILRPEAIESVFILYRLTGDRAYMDTAWNMWNSITKACRTQLAFAGISNVLVQPPAQSDRMESFWLAETLKYFYLIFSDFDEWSLDDWVLNTEAHFLRRPRAGSALTQG